MWVQRTIALRPRERGVHLVTRELVEALPELAGFDVGLAHLFIRHTSASLALNEDASAEVRTDLDAWLDRAVPDGAPYLCEHRDRGGSRSLVATLWGEGGAGVRR